MSRVVFQEQIVTEISDPSSVPLNLYSKRPDYDVKFALIFYILCQNFTDDQPSFAFNPLTAKFFLMTFFVNAI